ncbi:hypothetical protein [Peristeroidobacter agariperforans]|uniref:hypothetical protein n=1 Tax=Peristeroidobacter agariperforans TaxID=268404 RepID=UPI00101DBF84|nr:hypothetical protein [Peristeroidobacter agariperforans]
MTRFSMEVPARFREYACDDYFESPGLVDGVWSESEQVWLIVPANEIAERPENAFLIVGRPGVDGIEFGYRRGHGGVWAYYPQEARFAYLAADVQALVDGWLSGTIKV